MMVDSLCMITKQQSALVAAAVVVGIAGGLLVMRVLYLEKMSGSRPSVPRPPISSSRPNPTSPTPSTSGSPVTETTTETPTSPATPKHSGDAPLYVTTMTHMEEDFKDDTDKNLFERHVANMRWAMDLFDEYGAKLTFESEQPFAKANTVWGTNILKEVIDRGHGVGTHAGFGATKGTTLTVAELTAKFKENKALVDGLVGAENNRGVSGGTGPTDWILAEHAAGFEYTDAVTGFGYLSMPASARPDTWTNAYILKTGFHDPIPPEFAGRLYPIPMKDAKDLVPDADGVVVNMSGDIGELASLSEGRINCSPNCVLDSADVTAVLDAIKQADSIRDRSRVARVNVHVPMELLDKKNETVLRQLLAGIRVYVDKGSATWATQLGSYEGYRSW